MDSKQNNNSPLLSSAIFCNSSRRAFMPSHNCMSRLYHPASIYVNESLRSLWTHIHRDTPLLHGIFTKKWPPFPVGLGKNLRFALRKTSAAGSVKTQAFYSFGPDCYNRNDGGTVLMEKKCTPWSIPLTDCLWNLAGRQDHRTPCNCLSLWVYWYKSCLTVEDEAHYKIRKHPQVPPTAGVSKPYDWYCSLENVLLLVVHRSWPAFRSLRSQSQCIDRYKQLVFCTFANPLLHNAPSFLDHISWWPGERPACSFQGLELYLSQQLCLHTDRSQMSCHVFDQKHILAGPEEHKFR